MSYHEKQSKNGELQTQKLQSLSELKKALNKKLAGNREDVIDSPFHIRYTEFGADLYMEETLLKSFEDKGKLLNAVWNRDWEIILNATKENGKKRKNQSQNLDTWSTL